MTHPAHADVVASRKRQKAWVEGRARGGKVDRPGKARAFGGAAERKGSGQSTVDNYPTGEAAHEGAKADGRARGGGVGENASGYHTPPATKAVDDRSAENLRGGGGRLTAHERQSLPRSDFALPGRGAGPKGAGSGSYSIPNESHTRNALARSANKSPAVREAVRRKVHEKFPDIRES
jgi:hypothetical protein